MSVIASDIVYSGSYFMPSYDGAATLNGAVASTSAATIAINTPTAAFPASGEFGILVDTEAMWVTQGAPGASAGTLTVIRGFAGTTPATHSNGAAVSMLAGGPIDPTTKVTFTDIASSGDKVDYVSSSASDSLVMVTVTGRDITGVLQTETKTLNGQTVVNGTAVWGRLLAATLAAGTTSTSQITNVATTLAVAGHANFPGSGSYTIQMAKEQMTVTAGQGTNSWTVTRGVNGTTATVHQSGDNVYLVPFGDVAIVDHTKIITNSTAQTGSGNPSGITPALMKLKAGDGASVSVGQVIRTQGGTGPNQIRTIIATQASTPSYGTDYVAVSRTWSVVPDNTTTYDVYDGMQLDLLPDPITMATRFLWGAAADISGGSQRIFYQQVFATNTNSVTALTGCTIQMASESPSLPAGALLDLAAATAANGSVTASNRQTVPGSGFGSFVTQPSAVALGANSGNLAPGAAPNVAGSQAFCLRLTLPAGTAPYTGAATITTNGQTT